MGAESGQDRSGLRDPDSGNTCDELRGHGEERDRASLGRRINPRARNRTATKNPALATTLPVKSTAPPVATDWCQEPRTVSSAPPWDGDSSGDWEGAPVTAPSSPAGVLGLLIDPVSCSLPTRRHPVADTWFRGDVPRTSCEIGAADRPQFARRRPRSLRFAWEDLGADGPAQYQAPNPRSFDRSNRWILTGCAGPLNSARSSAPRCMRRRSGGAL